MSDTIIEILVCVPLLIAWALLIESPIKNLEVPHETKQ